KRRAAARSSTGKAKWKGGTVMLDACHRASLPAMTRAHEAFSARITDRRGFRLRLRAGRAVAADAARRRRAVRAGVAVEIAEAEPGRRLGLRARPVRGRAQLDRDRLHLPGGDAGLARLGRGRAAVALPRRLSGARRGPRLAVQGRGARGL